MFADMPPLSRRGASPYDNWSNCRPPTDLQLYMYRAGTELVASSQSADGMYINGPAGRMSRIIRISNFVPFTSSFKFTSTYNFIDSQIFSIFFACDCDTMHSPFFFASLLLLLFHPTTCHASTQPQDLMLAESPASEPDQERCQFGSKLYRVGDLWKPNLGEGLGVQACMLCTCVKSRPKSGPHVSRIKCRNIQQQCPLPNCAKPIFSAESCCPLCAGQSNVEIEKQLFQAHLLSTSSRTVKPPAKRHPSSSRRSSRWSSLRLLRSSPAEMNQLRVSGKQSGYQQDADDNHISPDPVESSKCYHQGRMMDEGSQWRPADELCSMCYCQVIFVQIFFCFKWVILHLLIVFSLSSSSSCPFCSRRFIQRGKVKCEQESCPVLPCSNSQNVAGQCCPVCPLESETRVNQKHGCFFEGDQRFHLAGSSWHPFLPPFGYETCALCTCSAATLAITCRRTESCPKLHCHESEALLERPTDCCKKCPVTAFRSDHNYELIHGMSKLSADEPHTNPIRPQSPSVSGGCLQKGQKYENGQRWHPMLQPFGQIKCVACQCTNGLVRCERIKNCLTKWYLPFCCRKSFFLM